MCASPDHPKPERVDRAIAWRFWLSLPFILTIRAYQVVLGPVMGGHCRFYPTCSHYAIEAYREHGPIRGTWLTVWRILRCQPLSRGGLDMVPGPRDRTQSRRAT